MTEKVNSPLIVVAGHPNEGKSSVLATLIEDDSIKISPFPGQTREAQYFPVKIDGKEVVRFVDTPGFQNPMRLLAWVRKKKDQDIHKVLEDFIDRYRDNPDFMDDCQLLRPLLDADVVMFVVDCSRPIRKVDKAEMEFLRLTGKTRVAILNTKTKEDTWLQEWKKQLRQYFNSVWFFNAHSANFKTKIALLESIKGIDYEIEPKISKVIHSFERQWQARCEQTAILITEMIKDILSFRSRKNFSGKPTPQEEEAIKNSLLEKYKRFAGITEKNTFEQIRMLFKHNELNPQFPPPEILEEDIFSQKTWNLLGLTRKQLFATGFTIGAYTGALLDLGHGGLSLGLFSLAGGIIGGVSAYAASNTMLSGLKIMGIKLDKHSLVIGPASNPQLLFILIDRALIYFRYIISWPHGKRDYHKVPETLKTEMERSFVKDWSKSQRKIAEKFFKMVTSERDKLDEDENIEKNFINLIKECLLEIS